MEQLWSDDKYAQKSVQLVRGSSFRSDFLQNPYFRMAYFFYVVCSKQTFPAKPVSVGKVSLVCSKWKSPILRSLCTVCSNKIRKAQIEHLNIVCQNLKCLYLLIYLIIFLNFLVFTSFTFRSRILLELVKSSSDGYFCEKAKFNNGGKFEFRS